MKIVLYAQTSAPGLGPECLVRRIHDVFGLIAGEKLTEEQLSEVFTLPVRKKVVNLLNGEDVDLDCADLVELGAVCQLSGIELLTSLGALSAWDALEPDSDQMIELLALRALYCRQLIKGSLSDALLESMQNLSSSLSRLSAHAFCPEYFEYADDNKYGKGTDNGNRAEPCPPIDWDTV